MSSDTGAPDYTEIYRNRCRDYDLLVERADFQGNLDAALRALPGVTGDVLELAAGTGRLTRRLVTQCRHVFAYDIEPSMLTVAREHLSHVDSDRWALGVADFRSVPQSNGQADLVIEGWGLDHLVMWNQGDWQAVIDTALGEMTRLARPGGSVAIIETLGTGLEQPQPPNSLLAQFYKYLESELRFQFRWLRTDYRFASAEEAQRLLSFFFGNELAVQFEGQTVVPECTGIWQREI